MARVADRGQLLLAAAFGLAIVLVVLALVVNSVVYTGTLATTDGSRDDERLAVRYHHGAVDGTRTVVDALNDRRHRSHATLVSNLSRDLARWDRLSGRVYTVEGAATATTVRGTTNETRLGQSRGRQLTDASGTENWTVAGSTPRLARASFDIDRASLAAVPSNESCAGTADCFTIVVDNGSDRREIAVYRPSGSSDVAVDVDGATTTTCSVTAARARVNLTAGTIGGTPCPALDVTAALDPPYTISYRRGDRATGAYDLVVGGVVSESPHFDNDAEPYARPRIYAVSIRVDVRTAELVYTTDARVRRGELDG